MQVQFNNRKLQYIYHSSQKIEQQPLYIHTHTSVCIHLWFAVFLYIKRKMAERSGRGEGSTCVFNFISNQINANQENNKKNTDLSPNWHSLKSPVIPSVGSGNSHTADGKINWHNPFGKEHILFSKVETGYSL